MTTPERSYGTNFRRAEEASNAQGVTQAALDFALKNAAKNPTQENKNIAKDTYAARQQTLTAQGKQPTQVASQVKTVIEDMPQQSEDLDKIIAESNAAMKAVDVAGREVGALTGQGWQDVTPTDNKMQDAYQRLYDEFNVLGLGALVSDAKDLLMKATSVAGMPDALRGTQAYRTRFSANDARIAGGLRALSPAEYLRLEDSYQNIMRQYGLPSTYYTVSKYGKQEGFDKLLANDISATELEDRVATAQQRVLNSNPEVLNALKEFYPDLNNGDILAYTLDPTNAIQKIKQKVTAAEIQGAANIFGLNKITAESTPEQVKALEARAQALAGYGVNKALATEGFAQVAEIAPRGSQLADIYKEAPYSQATAESEVFNTAGAAQAKAQRKKLKDLEQASFGGSSGVGALGRDKGIYGATSGQSGLY
jgi:hypothetical protein